MIIDITVQEPFFSLIQSGEKRVEGRVLKDKWREAKTGDTFRIYKNKEKKGGSFDAEVVHLFFCNDFQHMYNVYGDWLLPPDTWPKNGQKPWTVYDQFFDPKVVKECGCVAFILKVK